MLTSRIKFLLLTFLIGVPLTGAAQTTANLSGRVQDASGAVLPGVAVTARRVDTGFERQTTSDTAGRYALPSLPAGDYELRAELSGFRSLVRRGITLSIAQNVAVDLTMEVGGLAEAVTVTADTPTVNTRAGELSYLVDARAIEQLPLNGRNYTDLAYLQPGVVPFPHRDGGSVVAHGLGMSVNGQDPRANVYLLDGTLLNDMTNGPAGSAAGTALGMDTVQEFRVETNAYSAEFGRMSGGQVNVFTKAGGNVIRGTAFEFHRNDALDAKNYFDVGDKPPFTRNQFGGTIGGPVKQDKLFYFFGYEGLRENLGRTITSSVPDENARRGLLPDPANPGQFLNVGVNPAVAPYLNEYPLPNGTNLGDGTALYSFQFDQTLDQDFVQGRVDYNLAPGSAALRPLHPRRCRPAAAARLSAVPARLRVAQPVLHRRVPAGAVVEPVQHVSASATAARASARQSKPTPRCRRSCRARVHRQHRCRRPAALRHAELRRRALPAAGAQPAGRLRMDPRAPPGEGGRTGRALPAGHGQPDVQPRHLFLRQPARVHGESRHQLHRPHARGDVRCATGRSGWLAPTCRTNSGVHPRVTLTAGLR